MAKFKEIAAAVTKMGLEEAEKVFGKKELKAARDSLRREAERVRAKRERMGGESSDEIVTPTRTTKTREPAEVGIDRTPVDIEAEAKKARVKPDWLIEEVPEGVSTAKKGNRRMSRKRARELVERETGETKAEFEARLDKEARQTGVKPASGRGAEPLQPQYDLTTDQANDALRGKFKLPDEVETDEPDLVDLLKKYGRKKGGMVTKPTPAFKPTKPSSPFKASKPTKPTSPTKPIGVGAALRGWGKAMKGGR